MRCTDGSSVTGPFCARRTAAKPGACVRAEPPDEHATSRTSMIWYRFGEWIIRRRFLVLIVIGAMTAFFGYFAAKTELVTSFGDLLPQNHPFIKVAHQYEEFFGATNTVTIMIEAKDGDVYQPDIVQKIVNMTRNMD